MINKNLCQKSILNRDFALAREMIHDHKFPGKIVGLTQKFWSMVRLSWHLMLISSIFNKIFWHLNTSRTIVSDLSSMLFYYRKIPIKIIFANKKIFCLPLKKQQIIPENPCSEIKISALHLKCWKLLLKNCYLNYKPLGQSSLYHSLLHLLFPRSRPRCFQIHLLNSEPCSEYPQLIFQAAKKE